MTSPKPNSYECKACGAAFDTQEKLDGHNRREHPSGMTPAGASGTGKESWRGTEKKEETGREAGTGAGRGEDNPTDRSNR